MGDGVGGEFGYGLVPVGGRRGGLFGGGRGVGDGGFWGEDGGGESGSSDPRRMTRGEAWLRLQVAGDAGSLRE